MAAVGVGSPVKYNNNVAVQFVNAWEIEFIVVSSFLLQVAALFLAGYRRRSNSAVVKSIVWISYLLADSAATYGLGHLSVNSRPPERQQLVAFWAPFLLLHLGGPDSITAYSLEDNQLWKRILQKDFFTQVLGAAYVLYKTFPAGSGLLLPAAWVIFAIGVAKYAERIWALYNANMSNIRSALENDDNSDDEKQEEPPEVPVIIRYRRAPEDLLLYAHSQFEVCKSALVDSSSAKAKNISYLRRTIFSDVWEWEKRWTVFQMEVSLLYDIMYTKAGVIHTWYGYCLRVFSPLATAAALLLFHLSRSSTSSVGATSIAAMNSPPVLVDVAITYALLVGAILLDMVSLLSAAGSSWAFTYLVLGMPRRRHGWLYRAAVHSGMWLHRWLEYLRELINAHDRRRWSGAIGQYNVLQFCTATSEKRNYTTTTEEIPEGVMKLVFEELTRVILRTNMEGNSGTGNKDMSKEGIGLAKKDLTNNPSDQMEGIGSDLGDHSSHHVKWIGTSNKDLTNKSSDHVEGNESDLNDNSSGHGEGIGSGNKHLSNNFLNHVEGIGFDLNDNSSDHEEGIGSGKKDMMNKSLDRVEGISFDLRDNYSRDETFGSGRKDTSNKSLDHVEGIEPDLRDNSSGDETFASYGEDMSNKSSDHEEGIRSGNKSSDQIKNEYVTVEITQKLRRGVRRQTPKVSKPSAELTKLEGAATDSVGLIKAERGQLALRNLMAKKEGLVISIGDLKRYLRDEIQEGILIWHIATDVFLRTSESDEPAAMKQQHDSDHQTDQRVEAIKLLSNYMIFLMVERPSMVPGLALGKLYRQTCRALSKELAPGVNGDANKLAEILATKKRDNPVLQQDGKLALRGNALRYATKLALMLADLNEKFAHESTTLNGKPTSIPEKKRDDDLVQFLFEMWVEMLLYVSHRCSRESHAKRIGEGGELTTVVWLMAEQAGKFYIDKELSVAEEAEQAEEKDDDNYVLVISP
ncbi:Os04g0142600 [Oryza sativa Japonica Group]|uniref:OSJNBb0049I21.4 protein n=2 Tax=Oryza sativa subsp. japonica TaxID=39947 RepID=A3AQL5_ORYSJ|nr:hypothetical protein OsJ_13678 [Oryza sativa Japonica Group]BAS87770.1 Os04g0142600 [Oryza sativa Japonica Group]CAE02264.2 OSJNBb0049I21.4 [Oryza sativa Japonica Group]